MPNRWYLVRHVAGRQKRYGPITVEQLRQLAGSGKLQPDDLVCQEGMDRWIPVSELEALLREQHPALPPPDLPRVPIGGAWPEPVVVSSSRALTATDPSGSRQGSGRRPFLLAIGFCLITLTIAAVVLFMVSKSSRSPASAESKSRLGTITFAVHVDPLTLATQGESTSFTTGWVQVLIRSDRPFGDSKLVISYQSADGVWLLLEELVIDPSWTTATTRVHLARPGSFRFRASTSRTDVVAEGSIFVERATPNFGKSIAYGDNVVYFLPPVSEAEARRLGDYLSIGFFGADTSFAVQLRRTGDTYEFRRQVKKGVENDPDAVASNKRWCRVISREVFNGAPVDIHFCDEQFTTIRVIVDTDR